jgi:hypothetical protein
MKCLTRPGSIIIFKFNIQIIRILIYDLKKKFTNSAIIAYKVAHVVGDNKLLLHIAEVQALEVVVGAQEERKTAESVQLIRASVYYF